MIKEINDLLTLSGRKGFTYKKILIFAGIFLLGSLSIIVDAFLHPEIPHFDKEHLIVGGATALVAALLYFLLVRTEKKILQAHEEWSWTFNTIPDLIALIDNDHRLIRVNKALADKAGRSPDDLIGAPCYTYICGFDKPPSDCPHNQLMSDGRGHSVEMHLEHLGGDYFITASPLRDDKGTLTGSVHVARNTTERKRAEEALRQSEAMFRSLVEQSLVGIYIIRDDRFLYVNPKMAEIFGHTRDELVFSKSVSDLVAPESRAVVAENIRKRLEGEVRSLHYTFKGLRKDKAIIDVEVYGTRTEVDGKPAVIGTLLDITEKLLFEKVQRKAEERLYQQQKEQSIVTLAGGIAHDFNNILMGVLGYAELLKMSFPLRGKEQETTDAIIDSAKRMAHLTRQLLAYAKKGDFEQKAVSLNDTVREALHLTHKGRMKTIEVILPLSENLWPVYVDPEQMLQVIIALLTNGFEAMEKSGGSLTVRTSNVTNKDDWECPLGRSHPRGDYVLLSVSDTGPGIPEEMQRRLFEPFSTTKFMGRGLGLAAALGIVQNHNGCISVKRGEGRGAEFQVFLPRYAPEPEAPVREPRKNKKEPGPA